MSKCSDCQITSCSKNFMERTKDIGDCQFYVPNPNPQTRFEKLMAEMTVERMAYDRTRVISEYGEDLMFANDVVLCSMDHETALQAEIKWLNEVEE